jgi:hypothetical protein
MDHPTNNRGHASPTRLRRVAIGVTVTALSVSACGVTAPTPSPTTAPPPASASASAAAVVASATPAATSAPPVATPASSPIPRNPATVDEAVPYQPAIDPADFSTTIDNPFLPWVPGTTFVYEGGGEHIEVTVTADTRTVMGVETVVVRDTVTVKGKVTEDTFDWYAQDRAGNVWYFGEATISFEEDPAGDPAGSWEAGVDGAQPGVVMLADPRGGDVYRQEFLDGHAEDLALVRRLDGAIKVRSGSYHDVLVTEEWTPLEPNTVEYKYYARGIGNVAERVVVGGKDLVELIEVRQPGG